MRKLLIICTMPTHYIDTEDISVSHHLAVDAIYPTTLFKSNVSIMTAYSYYTIVIQCHRVRNNVTTLFQGSPEESHAWYDYTAGEYCFIQQLTQIRIYLIGYHHQLLLILMILVNLFAEY